MRRHTLLVVLLVTACSIPAPVEPPATPRRPVSDVYHGVEVVDDYRWLEDWSDPEVKAWSAAQNAHARSHLDGLPGLDTLRHEIREIVVSSSTSFFSVTAVGDGFLLLEERPPLPQPLLVWRPGLEDLDGDRVLVDPNRLDPEGLTTIDWYVPSPDGARVAVSLSRAGSELGDLRVIDTATGAPVGEEIPRVNGGTAGGDLAWAADGSGFFYTRYPRPGERPAEDEMFFQEIWFHALGTAGDDDRHELGHGFPKIAEWRLAADPSSARVLATYQLGDSGRFQLHLRHADGVWTQLTEEDDEVVQATWAPDGSLFLISRSGSPRGRILRLAPSAVTLDAAEEVVTEGDDAIVSSFYSAAPTMVASASRLYVTYQLGGPSTVRAFAHDGNPAPGPEIPPVASVSDLAPVADDALLVAVETYLRPRSLLLFDGAGATRPTALTETSPVDLADAEVVRAMATSEDGTAIPVNIIRPAGIELDGRRPTLLTGYGGYGISLTPRFQPLNRIWLDRGGVVAVANIRGGSEFGEAWHRAGRLTAKQNCFDDFAAAMRLVIDTGHTSPDRLAIRGGSNGGLLMGAMITQHPDAFRVTLSRVGIYDMLRVELSANGAFNIPEYGTVEDPEQFRALHAYSPYHRIEDGVAYPAVLLTTGANDPRVDPMQSRKLAARLQAATASHHPVLLRTTDIAGHGVAAPLDDRVDELAHGYAFLLNELGVAIGD